MVRTLVLLRQQGSCERKPTAPADNTADVARLAPRSSGALAPRSSGALAPRSSGALAPRSSGALAPRSSGALARGLPYPPRAAPSLLMEGETVCGACGNSAWPGRVGTLFACAHSLQPRGKHTAQPFPVVRAARLRLASCSALRSLPWHWHQGSAGARYLLSGAESLIPEPPHYSPTRPNPTHDRTNVLSLSL